jgi:hypothetical protein
VFGLYKPYSLSSAIYNTFTTASRHHGLSLDLYIKNSKIFSLSFKTKFYYFISVLSQKRQFISRIPISST